MPRCFPGLSLQAHAISNICKPEQCSFGPQLQGAEPIPSFEADLLKDLARLAYSDQRVSPAMDDEPRRMAFEARHASINSSHTLPRPLCLQVPINLRRHMYLYSFTCHFFGASLFKSKYNCNASMPSSPTNQSISGNYCLLAPMRVGRIDGSPAEVLLQSAKRMLARACSAWISCLGSSMGDRTVSL